MFDQIIDPATVTIGTIFYSSWGYEQTNITYYQLVRKSAKTLYLRKLQNEVLTGRDNLSMSGLVNPRIDNFRSEEIRKVMRTPKDYIRHDSELLQIWDGKPKHYTSYH